jgi:dihydrofolate reductase
LDNKKYNIVRKLKLQVQMSVDGFIAGPNGEMDWMLWNWDGALKQYVAKMTEDVDTILLGRKLAEGFIPYWAANPLQEGADTFNNTPKVVFTKTMEESTWVDTVLAKGELADEINQMKKKDGKNMIAYGGSKFVSALIKENLIDDYHLFINPTAVGKGMTIFNELEGKLDLELVKSTAFTCGMVVLNYKPKA